MSEKKSGLKNLFSKPNQDCCSVEIEEVQSTENDSCCGNSEKSSEKKQKET